MVNPVAPLALDCDLELLLKEKNTYSEIEYKETDIWCQVLLQGARGLSKFDEE
jgi:hypothetical protein